jgi:hypothetical protein
MQEIMVTTLLKSAWMHEQGNHLWNFELCRKPEQCERAVRLAWAEMEFDGVVASETLATVQ